MKVRTIEMISVRMITILNSSLQFSGLNGGYWGAVGIRGTVREKIKKQESQQQEKVKKDVKKKVKKESSDSSSIKSPSIKVENILSRITIKSALEKETSVNIATSILDEILLRLPLAEENPVQSSKSQKGKSPQKGRCNVEDELERSTNSFESLDSSITSKTVTLEKPKDEQLTVSLHPADAITDTDPVPSEDANIYDFVQEDFFDSFRDFSGSNDAENKNDLEDNITIDEGFDCDNEDLSKDDIWTSFNSIKDDIWSSVNDIKRKQDQSKTEKLMKKKRKNDKEVTVTTENIKPREDLLNSSFGSEFEGWPPGLDVKDEITEDDDVWASTNEILRDIEISISDVKAAKSKTERSGTKEKSKEETRKSRQSRKRTEETIGNPDSGKENADVDNVDLKKSDKTHSPVSKRKKIPNRKYFNEGEFEDSPYRSSLSSKRSSIDSVKSDSNSSSSRGRTTSTSTDEGSECETKRNAMEKDRKFVRNSHFKSSSKSIVLIDPINPEYVEEKKVHKSKKDAPMSHKRKEFYDTKNSIDSSVKKSNKPSTVLFDIFDEKFEKSRKDTTSRNQNKKK